MLPIKKPLKTKNISTPNAPKNLNITTPKCSESGNSRSAECENNINRIAAALTTSNPNIRCDWFDEILFTF